MDPYSPCNQRVSSGKIQKYQSVRGMHLPSCSLHELESVDDAVVIETDTSNVMAVIARRAEDYVRQPNISTHCWEGRDNRA